MKLYNFRLRTYSQTLLENQQLMLTMDISVEEYLKMGAFVLLVWTQWLQDTLYREV